MKKLAEQYYKNGYNFKQVQRIGNVAIYSQALPETGEIIAYEVFEVRQNRERVVNGRVLEAGESTPSNEQWGRKGYSVRSISEAMAKAGIIQDRIARRKLDKSLTQEPPF